LRWDVAVAAAAALICLTWLYRRDRRRHGERRGAFFNDCLSLFEQYRVTQDDIYFPVLEGRYQGYSVRLEPIVDHVVFRKIPSLWLKITLVAPTRYRGVFDLMMRLQGSEFYSPFGELPERVALPAGWPRDASIASDDPEAMPPLHVLEPHIRAFSDPRMKEMLVTPRGVRLVYQAEQAERVHYRVLRQIEFAVERLSISLARALLNESVELYRSVAAPAGTPLPAEQSDG
jgi:hypothetical protein